jgi:hypothetical protein
MNPVGHYWIHGATIEVMDFHEATSMVSMWFCSEVEDFNNGR